MFRNTRAVAYRKPAAPAVLPLLHALAMLLACLVPCASMAQGYPTKPIRLIVRAPPGGTDDLIARTMQPAVGKALGQSVLVDYRPGAGGLVAWEYVASSRPMATRCCSPPQVSRPSRRCEAMRPSIRFAISLG